MRVCECVGVLRRADALHASVQGERGVRSNKVSQQQGEPEAGDSQHTGASSRARSRKMRLAFTSSRHVRRM